MDAGVAARTRSARSAHACGFTLIEVLVVVAIIGMLATFAVLSIGGDSGREVQQREARRLLARMDLAREEAVMRAQSLGIRFERQGYRFFELRDGRWLAIDDGGVLRPRELAAAVETEVDLEGLGLSLADGGDTGDEGSAGEGDDRDGVRPQIFFLPGGEIAPPFTISLFSEDTRIEYRIEPGDKQWLSLSERRF